MNCLHIYIFAHNGTRSPSGLPTGNLARSSSDVSWGGKFVVCVSIFKDFLFYLRYPRLTENTVRCRYSAVNFPQVITIDNTLSSQYLVHEGVTGLCEGNSPVTGELPPQKASNAEDVSIWWRHHDYAVQKNRRVHIAQQWPNQNIYLI